MEHDAESSKRYKENWDDAVQASKADAAEIAELKEAYALLFKENALLRQKQADVWEAVKAERYACSIAVWMTLQDAMEPDADDKGLDGWMREAEQRVKNRLAHHRTEAHSVEHDRGA